MPITEVGFNKVEYGTGAESATFTLPLTSLGVQPGDVFLIEVICAVKGVALTGTPGVDNVIITSDTEPSSSANVRGSIHVYTVPETPPASITYTWASAVRGNLGYIHLRGEGDVVVDDETSSGWGNGAETSKTVASIDTLGPNAVIYGGLQVGSGSSTIGVQTGWVEKVSGTQRRGFIARKGVQALAGPTGDATFTSTSTNALRAWQVAFRDTADAGGGVIPGAIEGATTANLASPAGRWSKPINRVSWEHNGKWWAIVPSAAGHRFCELKEDGSHVLGAVVEASQSRRVAVVYREGVVYVLSYGSDAGIKFGKYNADTLAAITPLAVISNLTGYTIADTDATPVSFAISTSGYLWAGLYVGGNQRFFRSNDGGATWSTANSSAGIGGSRQGMLGYLRAGFSMVSYLTSNDGDGPRNSREYAEDWTGSIVGTPPTRSIPALPSGTTPDDHLSLTNSADGTGIILAKTTNADTNALLIYCQTFTPGQTVWSTHYAVETGPDGSGPSGTDPGYTRPAVTVAYDKIVAIYGSIYEPQNLSMRTASLSSPGTWSARDTILADGNFKDGAQLPDAESIRRAGAKFPVIAHETDSKALIVTWVNSNNPSPAPTFTDLIVGRPHHESISVAATVVGVAGSARLKVATNAALTENVVTGIASSPDSDGRFMLTADGLPPSTKFHYGIEAGGVDGFWYPTAKVGESHTIPAPDELTSYSFGFASCFDTLDPGLTSPTTGSYGRLLARNPWFYFDLGDKNYANNPSTSQASHRNDIIQTLTFSLAHRDICRNVPVIALNSDHDAGGGNNSFPGAYTPANRAANLQMYPFRDRPNPDGLYHAFTIGRIRYIVTDTRYFSQVGVTRLGAGQKAWFKAEMQRPEPVKVWVQESTWIDNEPNSGEDKWNDFPAEKAELGSFLATQAVGEVITIHGDQHAISADDGSHNPWGGFPSFCAAPWRNDSSIKTLSNSDWSEGIYPTSEDIEVAQYGWCDVTDNGTVITMSFKGYDTSNTVRVTLDFIVDTTPTSPTGVLIRLKTGEGTFESYRIKKYKDGTGTVRDIVRGAVKVEGGQIVPLQ